ncbi:hypothetical protein A8924_5745 [Saccharopolyspora erythraea NRRL 2338]|nr:hypothetical protein [Saccharopolyspora erythraea]EQD83099.1 hypothetical protein N599_27160 [Saccharopolyspora erythraea D]PFG98239.1 hypothetical protein A8924_5745 [Saccharopolyspora erythraea NRRL 2338]QRK88335.1 hypothetical protein JQX30_27140 [Saccharopolyspora erythraea]
MLIKRVLVAAALGLPLVFGAPGMAVADGDHHHKPVEHCKQHDCKPAKEHCKKDKDCKPEKQHCKKDQDCKSHEGKKSHHDKKSHHGKKSHGDKQEQALNNSNTQVNVHTNEQTGTQHS